MPLAIQLLGTPQFLLDDVPVTAGRRAVVALLAYLAVTDLEHPGQRFSRDSLAELFWTDYDPGKGLANLRHTLWEVAKFIGEGWVIAEHEMIYLNQRADLTSDLAKFRSLVRQAHRQADPALRVPPLADASRLYRDEFLNGFTLKEGSGFNEWVLTRAGSLHREYASILDMLVEDYSVLGQAHSAIPCAQRRIELDPVDEALHRKLMQLYALTGQHTAALQQYRSLEKLLRKELNLDPQPETRELYRRIRKGDFKPAPEKNQGLEPLRSGHNLPLHLTAFVGRERERDQIGRLIGDNRLVTLLGAGGIGKTRLALETGRTLLERHPDGVWFIPLESLADEDLVPQTVASFLGISNPSGGALIETLVNALRLRTLLLILDNCEHLLDACAQLAETLLKNCPGIRILATSRVVLRLEGEAAYHVPPLAIPEGQKAGSIEEIAASESIQLFVRRAALVRSGFEITNANARTLIRICDRLDGIPLAIELAAAHADIFTLDEILEQLNRSFDLLASNTRSVLPRHQTMRASIEWGWNLLTDDERSFLRRLSVFAGGWTLQAAQAMDIPNPRDQTSVLVKKSFIGVQRQTEQETRYGFHEVVRTFAQEKRVEADEEQTVRDRHLDYFLELSRQLEPALQGLDQELWLERLFVERDNIRTALEWAARADVQAGLYISNKLRAFWESCDAREERRWLLMI